MFARLIYPIFNFASSTSIAACNGLCSLQLNVSISHAHILAEKSGEDRIVGLLHVKYSPLNRWEG